VPQILVRPVKFFDVRVTVDSEDREFLTSVVEVKIFSVFAARFKLDCDNPAVRWTFILLQVNFIMN
jgi:hypothetical protein